VEESVGSWDSGEKAPVQCLGAELVETALRWTPALGVIGGRLLGYIPDLAAIE